MKKLITLAAAAMFSVAAFAQSIPYGNDGLFEPNNNLWVTNAPWNKCNLTYYFQNYTSDISTADSRSAIQAAFATWASVTSLTFTEVSSAASADIVILWGTGTHGTCPSAFDASGGVLAHAYYPGFSAIAGDVHFDDAETWALTHSPVVIDLQTVALHEIGHALGMGHSTVSTAVMAPYYTGLRRSLTADDISGIRTIYMSPIQGPINVCTSANTYTCNGPTSATYTWTVSSGLNILSGQGTNTVSINGNAGTLSGTICVTSSVSGCSTCKTVGFGSQMPSNITFARIGSSCEYQATATTVVGATSYQWSTNNFATYYSSSGPVDPNTYTSPSTVTLSVRVVTNCGTSAAKTVTRTLTRPPGCMARLGDPNADIPEENSEISVYPNPSDGIISLDVPALNVGQKVSVTDLTGRIIYSGVITNEHSSIDISAFESGAYILRIEGESEVFTQRIVLQH